MRFPNSTTSGEALANISIPLPPLAKDLLSHLLVTDRGVLLGIRAAHPPALGVLLPLAPLTQ